MVDADFFQHLVRFMEVALRRCATLLPYCLTGPMSGMHTALRNNYLTLQAQRAACLLPY